MSFDRLWADLLPVGRSADDGGYHRYTWAGADTDARAWFTEAATTRGLDVRTDRNGNLWAWWGAPGPGAVATGSHLDSVPNGGAFDGPLGVVGALAAVDELRSRGFTPDRSLAVGVFVEEEGGRFGVPCLGSRLATGGIDPARARGLTDAAGTTWAEAMAAAGLDPDGIGADPDLIGMFDVFVELHVEQGRALADTAHPVGVASSIWPHGRWRMDFTGRADHAGTTRLLDRADPMLPLAHTILAARALAEEHEARATVAKAHITPNGTNAIPSLVSAWLDARAADQDALAAVVDGVREAADRAARDHGVALAVAAESTTPLVEFSHDLRDRLAGIVADRVPESAGPVPILPTGAGHDAGVLSAHVPTAMLYVRNPTGVSHSPREWADPEDGRAGVVALADVLSDLLSAPGRTT
ncbi:allantoate amidohydrolase [Nocardiopsis sp. MG754419]|uniref:allantoate amidohydrolase n=1 Tax=Nocardiopsis sp. MG754419 TaxID=2259865 RepID=UPI001BAD4DBA|nr:allantoate amidohydrolase [Nocardiopsis sp. MG754419]MBR8742779.1 allantoate amidohydrolase [Nocardiopsis sp. MG754419]